MLGENCKCTCVSTLLTAVLSKNIYEARMGIRLADTLITSSSGVNIRGNSQRRTSSKRDMIIDVTAEKRKDPL